MNRRTFLATTWAGAATVGLGGVLYERATSDTEGTATAQPVKDPPEKVAASKPLAGAFYRRVAGDLTDPTVSIYKDGTVILDFDSSAGSSQALRGVFETLAMEYATTVREGGYDAKPLSMLVGPVQAIVTADAVSTYLNDRLNEKAYKKTIQLTDVQRTEP